MVLDWYSVTVQALQNLWQGFLGFIPALIGAIIIFVIGWFISIGIGKLITEILKKINKGITVARSEEAVRLCRKYGIKTVGYFVIGYLGETEETIKKTISFAKRIRLDYAAFFPATPMPATDLCKESESKGLIPKDYWRDFVLGRRDDPLPFIFPNAGDWVKKAYRQFYFSPLYVLKQMKKAEFYKTFFKNLMIGINLFFMKFKRGSVHR